MISISHPSNPPSEPEPLRLFVEPDLNTVHLNERVVVRTDPELGWRTVSVSGVVVARYALTDKQSHRIACVTLRLGGYATQLEICRVFGHGRATQARWEVRYVQEGVEALSVYRPEGRPVSIPKRLEDAVVALHEEGLGLRRIATRLGLSLNVVRGVYQRRGLQAHTRSEQPTLLEDEEAIEVEEGCDEAASSEAPEPWDGWLQPEYESGKKVAWAGVLLALPVLKQHRVLDVFLEVYRTLGFWAVYGLQTMVTLMVSLALWRIKRPERLKDYSPQDLGMALGLPRVPEVKTIRRKLAQMAERGKAREVMHKLAQARIEQQEDLLGYLYVDGHVRVYRGKYDLAKGYSTQRHMPVRATTDTWANDRNGDPVLLVTSEINEGLTKALEPVLGEVRALAGEGRKVTVIFDRGGWSPRLFVDLIRDGFDIITYRKGKSGDLAEESFEKRTATIEGQQVSYWLCDQAEVPVGKSKLDWGDGKPRPLRMRQVTRLNRQTGHQTKVLTTRRDIEPEVVLWRMFARWRQENFFKYMRQEFAVDGLVEYGSEPVAPELGRPNPEHSEVCKEIAALQTKILQRQGQRCELIGTTVTASPDPSGFEKYIPGHYQAEVLAEQIAEMKRELEELRAKRDAIPERISAGDLRRLRTERQQLATVFKIAAYRIETELVRMVAPYYARTENEGRKLIAAAFRSAANIEVTANELRVTLAPQSSPHRSRAIASLCSDLNKLETIVPGTTLRLVLDCTTESPQDVSS